tara:strand:- start:678 stop:797 length:120 start_codon:yes stop_codon:yes gene_type:complete
VLKITGFGVATTNRISVSKKELQSTPGNFTAPELYQNKK